MGEENLVKLQCNKNCQIQIGVNKKLLKNIGINIK